MAILVQQNILRFQISPYNPSFMQLFNPYHDLRNIEFSILLAHKHLVLDNINELSPWQEI
jgi:hypothetical protein